MALARLGAIITELAGSAGGTTFRRSGGNLVMYNRPRGISINKLRSNIRLPLLSSANKGWGLVPKGERDPFEQIARNVQFPDRFGNMRYLTPRQIFNKSAGRLIAYELNIPPFLDWVYTTPDVTINSVLADITNAVIQFSVSAASEDMHMLVYAVTSKRPFNEPIFGGTRVTAIIFVNGAGTYTLTPEFETANPGAQVGDYVRFYFRPLSIFGFPGNWQYFDTIAT